MSGLLDIAKMWNAKTYEPVKRNKDGVRWIGHRFPIKDGISIRDVMCAELNGKNVLMESTKDGTMTFRGIPVRVKA